jgi:HEAT repeat protein
MKAPRPQQIVAFVFVIIVTLVLHTYLPAQEGKPKLPAELKQKVDALIQQLGDDKWRVREAAEKELSQLLPKDPKAFDPLLAYLNEQMDTTQDVEVKVRLEGITKHYLEFGITSSLLEKFPNVLDRLTSPDEQIRETCVNNLGNSKQCDAVKPLIGALNDKAPQVRHAAASALGATGDERAVEPLIKALRDEGTYLSEFRNPPTVLIVAQAAADALGLIKDARAVEPLIKALQDASPEVRRSVVTALESIRDVRAVEPLTKALKDPDSWVRYYAVQALGQIKDSRAVEPLIKPRISEVGTKNNSFCPAKR